MLALLKRLKNMKKMFLLSFLLILTACAAKDRNYYKLHPKELQKVLAECPNKQSSTVSCNELAAIAVKTRKLAYDLQIDPQGFGKQILSMQETLAKQKESLKLHPEQPDLEKNIKDNQEQLAEYLAIVKWLESPES
jgi:hypothetical protein